jgi:hypothetical protein
MPHETELWLRLVIVEIYPSFADYDKAVYCLSSILSYDSDNINALLLLAREECILGVSIGLASILIIRLK